ncbi:MAG: paaE [Solirubrobacterales bacterium]|nr:paaE [Solirubrobacterales bacterium]
MSTLAGVDSIQRIPDPGEPVPAFAWPTLGLLVGGLTLFGGSTALAIADVWPDAVGVLVNAVAMFVLFTVSHDAAHHSASSVRGLNLWLGRLSTPFFAPHAGFGTWRFIHMQHHRFTNHDDGRDPDAYTNRGPGWMLPLRWATIDLWYMVFYLPKLPTRPRKEKLELFAQWAVVGGVAVACAATGNLGLFLLLYILPQRIAITVLGWAFDYLPHHGLHARATDGVAAKYQSTRNRVGFERLLSPLMLYQNYHLVHHLHPIVPFYRYVAVWRGNEEEHLANGPALSDVRGRELTVEEYRQLRELADHQH